MAQEQKPNVLIQIHDLINDAFDLDEFRELCLHLEVKYDNLRGETLSARIHDLVQQQNRQGKLDNLLHYCAYLRPNTPWPDPTAPVTLTAAPAAITAPQRNPRQIFLSHAGQDAEFAHQLAHDLERHGWQVWIAPDSIHPGEDWVQAINRGLAESGIFLLTLTPAAVHSPWVHSETNVAIGLQHQKALRFIPLDVKPATPPPLWQAYQWIPFQSNYKVGLERLLQAIEPAKVAQVDGLYRQMQQASGRRQWALVQSLGAQIGALYPDYRDTEAQVALAQQAEAREQQQEAEAAALYGRLQAAMTAADWTTALALANEIESLAPGFRDVRQLAARAHQGQRQNRRKTRRQWLRQLPVWGWVVAVVVLSGLLLGGVWALLPDGGGENVGNVTATPTPSIGSTRIRPVDEAIMVFVPAGEFMMGSEDRDNDEKPLHAVYLDSYWIDQLEVTNSMYTLCVRDRACEQPEDSGSLTWENYYPNTHFADYPVIDVSWENARNYCEWAGARLPTEAEWEKAARWDEEAQEARTYPWGELVDCDHANTNQCIGDTVAVGSYPDGISPYGALDMAGNVWEWTADWYADDYYAELVYDNPTGPAAGTFRVLRGGSFDSHGSDARTTIRTRSIYGQYWAGFRCAQE